MRLNNELSRIRAKMALLQGQISRTDCEIESDDLMISLRECEKQMDRLGERIKEKEVVS